MARFFLFLAVLWAAFYGLWRTFPGVRAGSVIIYSAKEQLEREGRIFPARIPPGERLIVFGNSKVLTGFIPHEFDRLIERRVYSYNMGKPDESNFVRDIEYLVRTRQIPRTILLTVPWSNAAPSALPGDREIMNRLFPFRTLPRDLVLFATLAPRHGGLRGFYAYSGETVAAMELDRGWYFIEGQSHYPNHALPDDHRLATDRAGYIDDPGFAPEGPEFRRLNELAERFDLHFYLVPSYYREGGLAPSPPRADGVTERMRSYPRFTALGPNYFLFPNRYFSDPMHLNPEGALLYTRRLAEIMAPFVGSETRALRGGAKYPSESPFRAPGLPRG